MKNYNFTFENEIRLKILKYWIWVSEKIQGNNKYIFEIENEIKKIEEENKEKNNKILIELYLFKIYYYITKKKKEEIFDVIEKCNKIIKEDDNFYLSRIYLLYGIYTYDIEYLKNAEKFAKRAKNIYLELKSKIMQIEYKLKNNDFNIFDEEFNKCEEIKKKYINTDNNLINSDIEEDLSNLMNLKKRLFNNYIKNMLFFFTSEPFYLENEDKNNKKEKYIALKTESNNDFYLKYNLSTVLPNLQFEFQKIDKDLDNLKKCVQYPIKFLYIGSDYFNDKGNICYVDDNFIGHFIDNSKIKKIIDESKCNESCDIVILGVLNSDKGADDSLFKIFESNNFRNIIYIKTLEPLIEKLKEYPFLYFYFQKTFFIFIKEFILKISNSSGRRLSIKESFRKVNNNFNEAIKKIISYEIDRQETPLINEDELNIIQIASKSVDDDYICDFGLFYDENNNSNINSIIHSNENDIYDGYDNEYMKQNYIYFRKNPFRNVSEQNNDIIFGKKYKKYYKFPEKGYLRENNFKKLIEKGFFSMKDILKDIINHIKNNKYTNLFGNIFRGKRKLCEEAYKYFYMNGLFKKGIFIVDIKNINTIKYLPELKCHNIKSNKTSKDILIVIENVNKLDNILFEWLEKLEIHTLFISNRQLEKNNWLKNDNNFYNIDKKAEEYKKNNPEFEEDYKIYEDIKFGNFSY